MLHSELSSCPPRIASRITLVKMGSDPAPIDPGAKGTVLSVQNTFLDRQIIGVKWDNGRVLNLVTPADEFEVNDLCLEAELCQEYDNWLVANGLPFVSADEQETEDLTSEQKAWLKGFIKRWDFWERLNSRRYDAENQTKGN